MASNLRAELRKDRNSGSDDFEDYPFDLDKVGNGTLGPFEYKAAKHAYKGCCLACNPNIKISAEARAEIKAFRDRLHEVIVRTDFERLGYSTTTY